MNQFQKNVKLIADRLTVQLSMNDFLYFTEESEEKIKKMGLPKSGCSINNVFVDANDMKYHQCQYCLLNCGLKCKAKTVSS